MDFRVSSSFEQSSKNVRERLLVVTLLIVFFPFSTRYYLRKQHSMCFTSSPFVIVAAIEKLQVFSRDSCVLAIPPPFTHWS